MKLSLILIVILSSLTTFAATEPVELQNLRAALQNVRTLKRLPDLRTRPGNPITESKVALPASVIATFNEIQKFIFNRTNLISLKSCTGCKAVADASVMAIYLDPQFLQTIKQELKGEADNIITYIIAHEISHYTYDYVTLKTVNRLGPNGNIPLLTKSFEDYVDVSLFATMDRIQKQREVFNYFTAASHSHADVDGLALVTLQAMGKSYVLEAKHSLENELPKNTDNDIAILDLKTRIEFLNYIFPTN